MSVLAPFLGSRSVCGLVSELFAVCPLPRPGSCVVLLYMGRVLYAVMYQISIVFTPSADKWCKIFRNPSRVSTTLFTAGRSPSVLLPATTFMRTSSEMVPVMQLVRPQPHPPNGYGRELRVWNKYRHWAHRRRIVCREVKSY